MSNIPTPKHASAAGTVALIDIIIPERLRSDTPEIRCKIEENIVPSIQEHGLIHPILLNWFTEPQEGKNLFGDKILSHYALIAGWSRLTAFSLLSYPEIPFNYHEDISQDEHYAIELEENIRRHEMTWQDKACAIDKIHKMKKKENKRWGLRQTGELIGQSLGHVQEATVFAKHIRKNDKEFIACSTASDARKLLAQRAQDKVIAELKLREANMPKLTVTKAQPKMPTMDLLESTDEEAPPEYATVDLSNIIHGDGLYPYDGKPPVLSTFEDESFDLIYTDIPYGIDMANLDDRTNINRVVDAHDVEDNLQQMPLFLAEAYRLLKDKSYLLFWMDIKHWEKLRAWGEDVGFSVQPYPLIWHKTHTCKNRAAHCHWTKNIEYVMVMRKGKASLDKPQNSCVFACSGYEERQTQSNPFSKPAEFTEWLLKPVVVPGFKVLDCYAGGGSLVRAMLSMGLDVVAVEKTDHDHAEMLESVKAFYRKKYAGYVNFI